MALALFDTNILIDALKGYKSRKVCKHRPPASTQTVV
jgi:hypothetical protein